MTQSEKTNLLPCPCCGSKYPFTYISAFVAVLRCDCGLEMKDGAVRVHYKREELPAALKPHSFEPELLVIRRSDGTEVGYPEHGYVGVNVIAAFEHAGLLSKWNRRVEAQP